MKVSRNKSGKAEEYLKCKTKILAGTWDSHTATGEMEVGREARTSPCSD